MVTYDPSIPPIAPTLTERRLEAALDRDVNVARIADALERIADRLADVLMPDTREYDDDERTQDPGPDDAPASPEDWAPVPGAWAFRTPDRCLVSVVRVFHSEGLTWARVIEEKTGRDIVVSVGALRAAPPHERRAWREANA